VDRSLREALLQAVNRTVPGVGSDLQAFDAAQIFPSRLDLVYVFVPGATNARPIYVMDTATGTDGQSHYRQR
jgi:hypothetical protein